MPAAAAICLAASPARANDFDTWARQVISDPDFKVRLSAGLRLGRLGDPRAVPVLTTALGDDVAAVRAIAASALGKAVSKEVPANDRREAAAALRRQMESDSDARARSAAKTAVAAFEFIDKVTRPRTTRGSVFVQVEPLADSTGSIDDPTRDQLTELARDSLLAANATFLVDWPGGRLPSRKQLKKAKARALVLMVTLTSMDVVERGKQAEVECKLNLILASYPHKAARTFVDGKAKLETGNRSKSIERAKRRCAMDLVQHLVGSRLARDVSTTAR